MKMLSAQEIEILESSSFTDKLVQQVKRFTNKEEALKFVNAELDKTDKYIYPIDMDRIKNAIRRIRG